MSEITKEELEIMLQMQAKATEQMLIVAKQLESISENQKEIVKRLYNGIAKEISELVCKEFAVCNDIEHETLTRIENTMKAVKDDTSKMCTVLTILSLVVAISLVITQFVHWFANLPK